ncbi:MAG: hypothetical protein HYZ42_01635, partial [Bacteroidetes bacterium]|nr:hypothetical protein [Bacteroidota bacterium]
MLSFTQIKKWIRTIIIPGLLFGLSNQANAQASITNYAFSASSGTYTALSGGTAPALSAGNRDEGYINNMALGFDFYYMGTRYTTASVSTNGWMRLGGSISGAASNNNLSSGGNRPVIAPLWDDLNMGSGTMSYKQSGSAPNRTFTFEWLNAKWKFGAAGPVISFQVILTETTGKIDFVYRQQTTAVSSGSASIGITATSGGSGNFLSLNGTGTNPGVSSTSETVSLNTKPLNGQTYTFTPTIPADPEDLQITGITQTAMNLAWTDNATDETGFAIYRSDDGGATYTYITKVAANDTDYSATTLVAGSEYYWLVAAISEGGMSNYIDANDFTLSPGVKVANTGTFSWNSTSAWVGGVVPTTTDSVVIPSGSTINITSTQSCLSLYIDGTLNYTGSTSTTTFAVTKYIKITSSGSFQAASNTGSKSLYVGGRSATTYGPGSISNDGVFDMNKGTNMTVPVVFYGNNNATIGGSGSTYDFYSITVNKGTTYLRVLDITSVITINAPTSSASRLTVTAGTFKMSSASNLTPYYGSQTLCATNGRIWMNNSSAVLSVASPGTTATTGSPTISGRFTLDAGTFSYGSGDNTFNISGGKLTINGGTLNFYGTVVFSNSVNNQFIMTGGVFNVDPQSGDQSRSNDVYYIHSSTLVNITGGTINIIDPNFNNASTKTEFNVAGTAASKNLSGLTLKLGNGSSSSAGSATTGGFVINMPSNVAIDSLVINNPTGSDRKVKINGSGLTFVTAKLKLTAGTLNLNGNTMSITTSITNSGVIDATNTASQLAIGGSTKQTIGGTIVSNQVGKITITNTDTVVFTPAVNVLRGLTLTSGFLRSAG